MNSARRERPPSGRSNYTPRPESESKPNSSRPLTANSARPVAAAALNIPRPSSARREYVPPPTSNNFPDVRRTAVDCNRQDFSARSDASNISTSELMRRLREKASAPKIAQDRAEIEALGEYNAFSRPIPSKDLPLRSVLLDPTVNNFPRSKTRTELMKKIRVSGAPHPSYDLNMDGYVSQEDYRLAKRFDFDGNGVLDPEERAVGKRVLADEFFKQHRNELELYGSNFAQNSHNTNVENLTHAYSFERAYERLKSVERTLNAESSEPILACMTAPDQSLTRYNYYTNKFDTTAWNDCDAVPRSTQGLSCNDDHRGSRKRLLFARKLNDRALCSNRINCAADKIPEIRTRRINLITDVKNENN